MEARNFLNDVHEGMPVFDRRHKEIGKVDLVQLGADNPATPDVEGDIADTVPLRTHTLVDTIASAFESDDLPAEVRERLLQQGFVRIDTAGLFAHDRYVLPDQILSVSSEELVLDVEKDELLKRH